MPITLTKKTDAIIVTWKEYDASPIKDSGIEVNDKGVEHYLIISGQKFKSVVTEDSLYNNGSRLGEKIQSEYFNINPSLTISAVEELQWDKSIQSSQTQLSNLANEAREEYRKGKTQEKDW